MTTRSAALTAAMSRGEGSNVSTTPPFGTMLVTSTFVPPTWRTMSARTVVVATTLSAPGAGVGPEAAGVAAPVQPATTSRMAATPRPSLSDEGGQTARARRIIGGQADAQAGQRPNSSRRWLSIRNPVRRSTARTMSRTPRSSISVVLPAALADDVVVVGGLAADVRVLAARQVDPLHDAQLAERVDRPEDRRPPDPEPPGAGVGEDVRRGERAVAVGDQAGHRPPRVRQPEACPVQGVEQWRRVSHQARNDTRSQSICRD